MIFTCTLNPSLDYYMEFDEELAEGRTNRSELEYYEAGGKGINVSIVLNNLGIPTRALGFVGGFTKDFYISLLAKYEHILPTFTYIDGHTRINVKLQGRMKTEMNATGPYITNKDMQNLLKKVDRLGKGDYLVFAGVTQDYLKPEIVKMIGKAIADDVKIVLDTNPDLMRSILPMKPFMIKTTPAELALMTGKKCGTEKQIIAAAKEVHKNGAQFVVILEPGEALFVYEEGVYKCALSQDEQKVNTVGTGDSLVAGFLMDYLRTQDPVDSFRFGASCGAATLYSRGLATREKIDALYETTDIDKLD